LNLASGHRSRTAVLRAKDLSALSSKPIDSETGNLSVDAQARYAFIAELLVRDLPPPARVIELGSAPGDQIAQLARRGYEATSLDLGESSDKWGSGEEGRMSGLLRECGVEDIRWNLEETPYPLRDSSFDAVVMTEVYEHLRDYPIRSLVEVHRILRPGGRLYFTTPNAAYIVNRFRGLAGKSTATGLADWIAGVPHARHAREYTFSEVDILMTQADLTVELRLSRHFHVGTGRSGSAARLAKRVLSEVAKRRRTFGPQIIMVARKPEMAG
jgi:SAM-dependent methyltransferase